MYSDLNEFLSDLERRKLLVRVTEPISPDLEIAAVTDRACKSPGGGPALVFTNVAGYDIPVATNVYGSNERMCQRPTALSRRSARIRTGSPGASVTSK